MVILPDYLFSLVSCHVLSHEAAPRSARDGVPQVPQLSLGKPGLIIGVLEFHQGHARSKTEILKKRWKIDHETYQAWPSSLRLKLNKSLSSKRATWPLVAIVRAQLPTTTMEFRLLSRFCARDPLAHFWYSGLDRRAAVFRSSCGWDHLEFPWVTFDGLPTSPFGSLQRWAESFRYF